MAFAAIHPEAGRIDATLPDLGCGLSWDAVYRARPRVALHCPGCRYGVHAKVSTRKLRYFAHDPGRPSDCAWLNESFEHHMLKLELANAIRDADWHAELEVRAPDGSWRADVLASSHDGIQRIAWEAQLSPISDEVIQERTARYRAEGIGVCWVSPAERVPWMGVVPSIRVRDPHDDRPWSVVDGIAEFDYQDGIWIAVADLKLTAFVRSALHGQAITHPVLPRYRRIWFGADERYARRQLIWTTNRHIVAEARHDAMRQRQQAWKQQQEEKERQAEQRRQQEEACQREIEAAAERARREEQQQQWAIEAERARKRREAEERQRQEQAQAAEQERLRREQQEHQAASRWWDELSHAQTQQLRDAVVDPVWKQEAVRVEFDTRGVTVDNAYGIAVYLRHRLYGILRPSPASLHRLPRTGAVFVRNAREAQLITDSGQVDHARVVHFDLPDHEQMSLM